MYFQPHRLILYNVQDFQVSYLPFINFDSGISFKNLYVLEVWLVGFNIVSMIPILNESPLFLSYEISSASD